MLAVGGFAAAGFAEEDDGLVLPGGQQVPVGRLSHGVNVRRHVLATAAFEHVHHLRTAQRGQRDLFYLLNARLLTLNNLHLKHRIKLVSHIIAEAKYRVRTDFYFKFFRTFPGP